MGNDDHDISVEAVWGKMAVAAEGETGRGASPWRQFDPSGAAGILEELTQLEADSVHAVDPLGFFREAIAQRVDRRSGSHRLYQLSRKPPGDMEEDPSVQSLFLVIADMDIQITVLREYCRRRFDDVHDRDWFEAYWSLSELFHERMGRSKNRVKTPCFILTTSTGLSAETPFRSAGDDA
ncbi:MAG: hypothetical protein PVH30_05820 [Desulfobacterales bacterium]